MPVSHTSFRNRTGAILGQGCNIQQLQGIGMGGHEAIVRTTSLGFKFATGHIATLKEKDHLSKKRFRNVSRALEAEKYEAVTSGQREAIDTNQKHPRHQRPP